MTPAPLDDLMARAIGHAVAGFGALEHALKAAILAVSRDRLGASVGDAALRAWLMRMENLADDSMGTLVDAFVAAIKLTDLPDRHALATELRALRLMRNLICHAAWVPGTRTDAWRPLFLPARGETFEGDLTPGDLHDLHARTRATIARLRVIAQDAAGSAEPGPEG